LQPGHPFAHLGDLPGDLVAEDVGKCGRPFPDSRPDRQIEAVDGTPVDPEENLAAAWPGSGDVSEDEGTVRFFDEDCAHGGRCHVVIVRSRAFTRQSIADARLAIFLPMTLSKNVGTLTCFACGKSQDAHRLTTVCDSCALPLRVDLQLPGAPPEDVIHTGISSMWRYVDVLPVDLDHAVTLVEGWTPLIEMDSRTWIKDEARNPTGSFKARGMSMAVSAAVALGAERLVAPSAGNAASALSAYGASAGVPVVVAMPDDTPKPFIDECRHYGAEVKLVAGTIADAGKWLAANRGPKDFDVSTLKEPYRVEGKKTMGYELFEQFQGDLPEVVVYPTGGGTGLVGMWKAWNEMERMGWIGSRRPRLVSVQTAGCAPIVRGFETGAEFTEPWDDPHTTAYGLRVPGPIGGFVCLRAIRETDGTAIAIDEDELHRQTSALAAATGVDVCPEGGAAWAATTQLRESGWIAEDDRVVVFNTGTGLKYR
jgi:threonine synthase